MEILLKLSPLLLVAGAMAELYRGNYGWALFAALTGIVTQFVIFGNNGF